MKMVERIGCVVMAVVMFLVTTFVLMCNQVNASTDIHSEVETGNYVTDVEQIGNCGRDLIVVSESSTMPLTISSSSLNVSGELFSNCAVCATQGRKIVTPQGYALYTYNIFEEVFDRAVGFEYHEGPYLRGGSKIFANEFAEEKLNITGQEVICGSLIGASEDVLLSGSNIQNQSSDQPAYIMAVNGDIRINADQLKLYGIIYAPNGQVEINVNTLDFRGRIIANEVVIRGNRVELKAGDIGIPIEMYSVDPEDAFTGDIMQAGYVGGSSTSSSGSQSYYYNTGGNGRDCAKYNRYKLVQRLKVGDIVYEAEGFHGLTGHIAVVHKFIVHSKYIYHGDSYAGSYSVTQIQVIEAISEGVCFGLLDDVRCDEMKVTILRTSQLTESKWKKSRDFLEKQLGKPYNFELGRKVGSINRPYWYCSELAWAAFYYVGIDIDRKEYGEPGVTPHDIYNNQSLMRINYR